MLTLIISASYLIDCEIEKSNRCYLEGVCTPFAVYRNSRCEGQERRARTASDLA